MISIFSETVISYISRESIHVYIYIYIYIYVCVYVYIYIVYICIYIYIYIMTQLSVEFIARYLNCQAV
jgi:hypothetical protein